MTENLTDLTNPNRTEVSVLSTVSTVVLNQAVEAGPHDTEPGYTHTHTQRARSLVKTLRLLKRGRYNFQASCMEYPLHCPEFIYLFIFLISLLEYNCFTMLC